MKCMRRQKKSRQERFQHRSRWRYLWWGVFAILMIVTAYAGYTWSKINETFETLNTQPVVERSRASQPIEVKKLRAKDISLEAGDPINILLLGTDDDGRGRDEAKGYVSRSDAMIVLSLNPKTRSTKMLSIPRDVYAFIQGQPGPDKINHAYAFGGVDLSIDTVQNFLNLPIDYYAVINMQGLEHLVDAVGGIDITSPITFTYQESSFVAGETRHVDGWNAMNFARMRYDDPEGETGRQNRQKLVIKALVDKLATAQSVTSFPQLLEAVAANVKTNITIEKAITIYGQYKSALQNISAIRFEGLEDLYVNEVYYFYAPMTTRLKAANELRKNSGLSPITAAALKDPLGDQAGDTVNQPILSKTAKLIINQYPTGLSEAELATVQQNQRVAQTIRQADTYTSRAPIYEVSERQNVETIEETRTSSSSSSSSSWIWIPPSSSSVSSSVPEFSIPSYSTPTNRFPSNEVEETPTGNEFHSNEGIGAPDNFGSPTDAEFPGTEGTGNE